MNGSDREGCGKQPEAACATLGYLLDQTNRLQVPLVDKGGTSNTKDKLENLSLMGNGTENASELTDPSLTIHVITDMSLDIDNDMVVSIILLILCFFCIE